MDDNLNNDIKNTNTSSADEVVDDIPEDAKHIDTESHTNYSSFNINTSTSNECSLISIFSLALGIFSVICCCSVIPSGISAVIGLILGIIAFRNQSDNRTVAVIGIILSSIGLAIFIATLAFCVIAGSFNASFQVPPDVPNMHSMNM